MHIYKILIAVLLGAVTLMGFKLMQEPQEDVSVNTTEIVSVGIEEKNDAPSLNGDTIDMRNQGLTTVPEYVFNKRGTEVLLLSDNNLNGSLPAEIRQLQDLKILDLSNNNFTGVPAEIGQLDKLEVLNLSGNPITGLPFELGNLQSLRVLDLRDTQYSQYDLDKIQKALPASVEINTTFN